jgi:hypothetical protein
MASTTIRMSAEFLAGSCAADVDQLDRRLVELRLYSE